MNWKDLIEELQALGLTKTEIAAGAGLSTAFVSELASGKKGSRIGYDTGTRLVNLRDAKRQEHAEVVPSGSSSGQAAA